MIRSALTACAGAALACTVPPVHAAALKVTPVLIRVDSGKQFCALSIGNDSDEPVHVQIRGYGWNKDRDGNDVLDPHAGVAVNPSILTLAPGKEGLVRCALPTIASSREETWRLIVDELPAPGQASAPGIIKTRLRLSIPVFRAPDNARATLSWSQQGGTVRLDNTGDRHVRVLGLTYELPAAHSGAQRVDRSFYLLAGGSTLFPAPAGVTALSVLTPDGPMPVRSPAAPLVAGR